jgi:hypothetical protein
MCEKKCASTVAVWAGWLSGGDSTVQLAATKPEIDMRMENDQYSYIHYCLKLHQLLTTWRTPQHKWNVDLHQWSESSLEGTFVSIVLLVMPAALIIRIIRI